MSSVLFALRMLIYYFIVMLPLIHPAVEVSYDLPMALLYLLLVPAAMLISFLRWKKGGQIWLIVSLCLFGLSFLLNIFLLGGFFDFILPVLAFYALTWALFSRRLRFVAALEFLIIPPLLYRLISFTRANEEIARSAQHFLPFLLASFFVLLLVYGWLLFRISFQVREKSARPYIEGGITALLMIALIIGFFMLPLDHIMHDIVINPAEDEIEAESPPGQNDPGLSLLEAERWGQRSREGRGGNRQYAVMVVSSQMDPVYAAGTYLSALDPDKGFGPASEDKLNFLKHQRLASTWKNTTLIEGQSKRNYIESEFLSTLPERYMPYAPLSLLPTVDNPKFFPFRYYYSGSSLSRHLALQEILALPELEDWQKKELAFWLKTPLNKTDRDYFRSFLDNITNPGDTSYQKLAALLKTYGEYQYYLGKDERTEISRLREFLEKTKTGDCTEFSHTTALLARMTGIPSRVVNGFLATSALQTPSHQKGLRLLAERIPRLREMAGPHFFLVTTAHRHSWVQFFLPGYGWIDFETTSYAIAPEMEGDPNSANVVIPKITEKSIKKRQPPFPWFFLLRVFLFTAGGLLILLYFLRWGYPLYLLLRGRQKNQHGLLALYKLLVFRLSVSGRYQKKPGETSRELSEAVPETAEFCSLFEKLRYREFYNAQDEERFWQESRHIFRKAYRSCAAKGLAGQLKAFFNLKAISRIN